MVLPPGTEVAAAIATVEATGYTATLPAPPHPSESGSTATGSGEPVEDPEVASLRRRLIVSAALTVPVLVLAMVPAFQFRNWQWLSLTLAAPVVVWGAWPFHRAAWANLRHRAATMDTLISLGTLAAFGWSLYALFFGDAGHAGHEDDVHVRRARAGPARTRSISRSRRRSPCSSSPGRYFEARAKRRSGAALRELLELGAKDVAVLRDGVESRVPIGELRVGDQSSSSDRGRRSRPTASCSKGRRRSTPPC